VSDQKKRRMRKRRWRKRRRRKAVMRPMTGREEKRGGRERWLTLSALIRKPYLARQGFLELRGSPIWFCTGTKTVFGSVRLRLSRLRVMARKGMTMKAPKVRK
jgi:hypothetical protein